MGPSQGYVATQPGQMARNLGIILGSGCLVTKEDTQEGNDNRYNPKKKSGTDRLLQILISEAAHLIWVLRCERVIQEQTHAPQEVKARWIKVINRCLTNNKIIMSQSRDQNHSPSL